MARLPAEQQRRGEPTTGPDRRPVPDAPGGPGATPPASRMPPGRTWLTFALILVVNFLLVRFLYPDPNAPVKVPYTLFKAQVAQGNVERIFSQGTSITGRFDSTVTYRAQADSASRERPRDVTNFATELPAFVDPGLESLLIANDVEISAEPIQQGGGWTGMLLSFAPALLLIGLYVWFFRRALLVPMLPVSPPARPPCFDARRKNQT